MKRPDDLPPAEHYSHGTRARYVAGCRCDQCRTANREYARQRVRAQIRGDWNGLVDSTEAREHLIVLSNLGVGRRAVHAASDVALTVLEDIKSGKKTRIRARTEKAILRVDKDAISDSALIPAKETWAAIRQILRWGYTRGEIARRLGSQTPALQLRKKFVLASTESRVLKVYRELQEEMKIQEEMKTFCTACANSHDKDSRLTALRVSLLPGSTLALKEAWSCVYGGMAGERTLYRDLHELGAVNDRPRDPESVWRIAR